MRRQPVTVIRSSALTTVATKMFSLSARLLKRILPINCSVGRSLHAQCDAVVVGGGHNGLVAAAYLAKSGRRVVVLERRHVAGGAAVTEEVVPGFRFSRASYLLSLLRPAIARELELSRHGLRVFARDPSSFTPLADGRSLTLGMDAERNKLEIAKFSPRDAEEFERYESRLSSFADLIEPVLDLSPSELATIFGKDSSTMERLRRLMFLKEPLKDVGKAAIKADLSALYELITAPAEKILNRTFESDVLKATLATDATIGAMIGPSTPGGGYVLLHHVMGELEGVRGAWGYPRGGMGAVSAALAAAAAEAGAQIATEREVRQILVGDDGRAEGVRLSDGAEIRAPVVLSNLTARTTFLDLLSGDESLLGAEFVSAVRRIDYTSPVTKINVAVDRIPNFSAVPNSPTRDSVMPHHRATIHLNCESMQLLEEAFSDAHDKGEISAQPMIELVIPSSLDDSLSPPGQHVCLLFTQYTPFHLRDGRQWDEGQKEEYARTIFNTVERYAPGFSSSIVGFEVLSPPDLEREFGLSGGNIFHGAMSLHQLFLARPVATDQCFSPETPVRGLYLCGSGAHPGGGVMGAPGRLAARVAITKEGDRWPWA